MTSQPGQAESKAVQRPVPGHWQGPFVYTRSTWSTRVDRVPSTPSNRVDRYPPLLSTGRPGAHAPLSRHRIWSSVDQWSGVRILTGCQIRILVGRTALASASSIQQGGPPGLLLLGPFAGEDLHGPVVRSVDDCAHFFVCWLAGEGRIGRQIG